MTPAITPELRERAGKDRPISRRGFLLGTSAVAVAAALPGVPAAPAVAKVAAAPLPTWIVGTPGEWDHEVIRAATREAAIAFRAEACDFEDDPDADPNNGDGGPSCECYACTDRSGYEATRVAAWDGRPKGSITDCDWLEAGFDARCDRCDDVATQEDNGRNVSGKAICGDCMTLADWDIVDPEYAAELRAEQADGIDAPPATPLATGEAENPIPPTRLSAQALTIMGER